MAGFKFNFCHPKGGQEEEQQGDISPQKLQTEMAATEHVFNEEDWQRRILSLSAENDQENLKERLQINANSKEEPNITLNYLSTQYIDQSFNHIKDKNLLEVIKHSDLSSGIYEGGFKVWECTVDLIKYLSENRHLIEDKKILDLGCGAGLPGIFCLLHGADHVCFQDYNPEVINNFTFPNVCLNLLTELETSTDEKTSSKIVSRLPVYKRSPLSCDIRNKTSFFSGDWASFGTLLRKKDDKFDLILSSETIYNTENYPKLKPLISNHLKQDGMALFSAKSYYFGVGGSTEDFKEFVKSKSFDVKTVCHVTEGVNREILDIRKV